MANIELSIIIYIDPLTQFSEGMGFLFVLLLWWVLLMVVLGYSTLRVHMQL